jgi:serine/threonine-protein kinase
VLYEVLTGRRPFDGEDVSEVLAAVIKSDPDWSALPAIQPAFLRRCLEKDPRQRIHDIADVRLALEGAFDAAALRPLASAV